MATSFTVDTVQKGTGGSVCHVSVPQSRVGKAEFDALGKRLVAAEVDGACLATHVRLPGIAARFATAAGILLAAEGTADFGTWQNCVVCFGRPLRRSVELSPRSLAVSGVPGGMLFQVTQSSLATRH